MIPPSGGEKFQRSDSLDRDVTCKPNYISVALAREEQPGP
jgi:hypothetical protein